MVVDGWGSNGTVSLLSRCLRLSSAASFLERLTGLGAVGVLGPEVARNLAAPWEELFAVPALLLWRLLFLL